MRSPALESMLRASGHSGIRHWEHARGLQVQLDARVSVSPWLVFSPVLPSGHILLVDGNHRAIASYWQWQRGRPSQQFVAVFGYSSTLEHDVASGIADMFPFVCAPLIV